MFALSVICFANASSPKGRAKKRERAVHMPHQAISCADLPACCSFRHGLRRATFLREKGFGSAQSNLSLPLGEMSRSDREGIFLETAIFSIKKALRGVLFLFSWTMYCWMFGWLRCRQCCRCFLCFPCFRCLRPHRSLWSIPNPHL